MYGDACLGEVKRRSELDDAVSSSEIDITEGDKFSFRGNVGTVANIGDNKGKKILFCFLTFFVLNLHLNILLFLFTVTNEIETTNSDITNKYLKVNL